MSVPKHDTIVRYCSNGTAIQILLDRGIITPEEAQTFFDRDRERSNAAYARIYGEPVEAL